METPLLELVDGVLASVVVSYLPLRDFWAMLVSCQGLKALEADAVIWADLAGRGWWPRTVLPHVSSGPPQPSQAESMIWRARLRRWHTCKFSWRTLAPHGDPLPAMFLHRCGIIAEANCAVIFGGSSINNFLNDAWAVTLDAQEGQQEDSRVESAASGPSVHVHRLRVAGPSSHGRKPTQRSACSLVNVGPSLFLFGGSGRFGDFFDDLWRLDLTIPSTTQGAAAEQSMSAAPVEEVRYTKITGLEGPCGRWGHVGVGHLGKMWIFGGTCPGEAFNDLWCFDPSNHTWVEIRPGDALLEESAESCPSSTSAAAAAGEEEVDTEPTEENEVSQERYGATYAGSEEEEEEEFGSDGVDSEGSWTSESFDDLEEEEAAMAHMRRRRPAGRGGHAGCVVGRYFYVHGGNTVENSFKDCWRVDLTALNEAVDGAAAERSVPADGAPSSPREDSSSSSDGGGSAVGTSVATNYDAATAAAVVLRVEDVRWEEVHENRAPPARIGHTMIAMGNRIILYGGRDYIHHQFQGGVWCLDTILLKWRRVDIPGPQPQLRTGHLALGHEDGVVFLGGLGEPTSSGPLPSPFPSDSAIFLDLTSHAQPASLPPSA